MTERSVHLDRLNPESAGALPVVVDKAAPRFGGKR